MAAHSSILAWKIPRMEEPSRLQSMGSHRVRYDRVTSLSLFSFTILSSSWIISEDNKSASLKRYMYRNSQSNIIYSFQDMEAT